MSHQFQKVSVAEFCSSAPVINAGSAFLGALAAAPALVEATTGLQAFRGFAGTSVLIIVGVATDTARKFRAEIAMQKYGDIDKLYDDMKP